MSWGFIKDWWTVIATLAGSIASLFVWAASLNRKMSENRIRIEQLEKTREIDNNSLNRRLDELNTNQRIMAQDIKTIMMTLVHQNGDKNG